MAHKISHLNVFAVSSIKCTPMFAILAAFVLQTVFNK